MTFNYRNLSLPILLTSLASCGDSSGGGGGAAAPAQSQNPAYTMVVSASSDLPVCGRSNLKQLVYVSSESTFKSCDAAGWTNIEIKGKDSPSGTTILSNQLLNSYNTNICTMYSSIESCYFNGGQIVKYSDGTVFITSAYSYELYVTAAANGGYAESDRLANSISMIVPPNTQAAFQRLDWDVSHAGVTFKQLYLVYERATDEVKIIFDTNGSNSVNQGDTTVHTVTRSNW